MCNSGICSGLYPTNTDANNYFLVLDKDFEVGALMDSGENALWGSLG